MIAFVRCRITPPEARSATIAAMWQPRQPALQPGFHVLDPVSLAERHVALRGPTQRVDDARVEGHVEQRAVCGLAVRSPRA